ncbi:MAG: PAS/PAC sensor signal transduction histidine kinase [Candidatus Nomurabacteria bacterium GW2011_GWE1_32_28]|uniref:PAS/PAC sensor signal transduction histidine kinase n=1 Tax=Candidatus Nomurabacteria bacterium GW2011_GWF1_31_48 TaxID=1618767 RepID=A0A0F9YU20_9BACT|nr:MAG: PAS/PAC sensor signal transduction histidine kinase [Candidatus Nomurabacteria bacterium GW2011_GWF2_30_133]KKP28381.1 MAG: PAS/PAC sensor signal transduction histidine kinase [Candidatus Nomurabacteria bacterium GW2011_GWE2_31_40]KKP29966.1 MAG: PAS/PAC sensor signal transduction histidine kinase [Candidatus Nomurabacteria bacterium GW2011_GWF1_31_48]KKP35107.1 MAG: PAS/PAC sensor signal transduction histidine kinase [Candidatus Nomurabacteria bacterium GW2011_GWE1_32_28]HAS80919.1 hyp
MEKVFRVFEKSYDGVFISDYSGKVIFLNDSLEKIIGFKKEEILGKNLKNLEELLFSKENISEYLKDFNLESLWTSDVFKKFVTNLEGRLQEFSIRREDCSIVFVEQIFFIFEDDDTFFVISIIRDITECKKLREDFLNFQRTFSHDVRSPLSSLISISSFLLEELENKDFSLEDTKEFVLTLNKIGRKMLHMMEDYLLLEALENGKQIEKAPKVISELLGELKSIFSNFKSKKKIQILFKKHEIENSNFDLLQKKVMINENLFSSVLNNLIGNAIEADQEIDNKIIINIYEESRYLFLSFSNPGEIPEEIRSKLFQKFTSGKKNGTGIGLFSSMLIIKAHLGDLYYEPLEGVTRFTIKIPMFPMF